MSRISILARRQRLKNLELWAVRAVLAETFFLAIFPSVAAVAVVLGTVVWFLRLQVDAKFKLRSLPFDVPIMLFVILSAVSVFHSPARDAELIYKFFSLLGIFMMTYLLVGQNIRTVAQVKLFVKALAASALIVVLCGFFQYVFGIDVAEITWTDAEAFPEMRKRVFSTMENPNVLAGFLDVAICFALGLFAKVSDGRIRFLAAASVFMAAACLLMTYSSGPLVTMLIIFAIYGLIQDWRILILMAAAASFLLYNDAEKILSLFNTTVDMTAELRAGIWVGAIAMISDHPFAGIGFGAFEAVYPQYSHYAEAAGVAVKHAHNLFLNVAAEIGIAGALAFCWYFFGTMLTALILSSNERYAKIKNAAAETARRAAESKFNKKLAEVIVTSKFLQEIAQMKSMILTRMSELSNSLLDKIFPAKAKEKSGAVKKDPNLVHHEEMKWGKKSGRKKSDDDDKMDLQKFAEEEEEEDWREWKAARDEQIIAGVRLGTGLAFLSLALNGMGDDLLADVPSALLMWQLGALGAAVNLVDEEQG
ncbi:MAG: O-antigen ligase family protein [Selenomonadaceae bacterium]|nr:O-antigen ligase family protein [Selenomonadaceae bacterium]